MFRFFKKKVVFTPQARAEAARGIIVKAFEMFSTAHSALDAANSELLSVANEHDKNIAYHEAQLSSEKNTKTRILDDIAANQALQTRLKDFIPQ